MLPPGDWQAGALGALEASSSGQARREGGLAVAFQKHLNYFLRKAIGSGR